MNSKLLRMMFSMALVLTVAGNVYADKKCSNESLRGTFGEIGWGDIPDPVFAALKGPFVRVGQTIADGAGEVTSHTAASFNGIIFQVDSYFGTYDVTPDCFVNFHMQIPIPNDPDPPFIRVVPQ